MESLGEISNEELHDEYLSFSGRALERRKKYKSQTEMYMDIRFLLPTSNLCKRSFLNASYALCDRRKNLRSLLRYSKTKNGR